jgi:hypothetical protein
MIGEARMKGTPPHFLVSVDSKGLDRPVSPLEAILTRRLASIDFKRLRGLHNEHAVSEFLLKAQKDSGSEKKKAAAGLPQSKWMCTYGKSTPRGMICPEKRWVGTVSVSDYPTNLALKCDRR